MMTLPARWAAQWARSPSAPAMRFGDGPWVSTAELNQRSATAGMALSGLGVAAGDRVLWSATTSLPAVVAALGVLRLGAVLVPVNPGYTRAEVAYVATDARAACAIVEGAEARGWVAEAAPATQVLDLSLEPRVRTGGGPGDPSPLLDGAALGDPALIVYTSGTTGRPKGAVLTHANMAAGVECLVAAWGWGHDDRLLLALPLFHVHGLCAGLFGSLTAGAPAVVHERFSPGRVLAAAGDVSMFFGVPTMYHRLAADPGCGELRSLRLCVSGSAPLPIALFEALAARTGQRVLERYGMSETLLTISNPLEGERRPGSVGLPLPGVELELDGGELWVRGPSVFAGYFERPEATAEAFTEGWFHTGDLAAIAPDGYVTILGRAKDLIISGGFNVYPAEVEDALVRHPAIREVSVAGSPSEEWGEAVTAWIVTDGPAPSVEELGVFCAASLAAYKRPRLVRVVDSLPRNAMGKVLRHELR